MTADGGDRGFQLSVFKLIGDPGAGGGGG